jgi:hypothetical protein
LSAWGIIVIELGLGTGLLIFFRPRLILSLTALLFLLFMGATAWAWWSGAAADCGCFGSWVKRTPGEALIENLVLITAALFALFGPWHLPEAKNRARLSAVIAACLIGMALPPVFGFSISQVGRSGWEPLERELGRLQIQGIKPVDLRDGDFFIIMMDTECDHCADAVEDLNALALKDDLPRVLALCMNDADRRLNFQERFDPAFPIGQIEEASFWRLLGQGDVPRFILVRDLKVKQVWDNEVPAGDEIKKF